MDREDPRSVQDLLDRSLIALPLMRELDRASGADDGERRHPVVIDLNLGYAGGTAAAAQRVRELLDQVGPEAGEAPVEGLSAPPSQFVAARLSAVAIRRLAELDRQSARGRPDRRAVYRIWPDFPVRPHTNRSVATVKVDAARATFAALGEGITWAVVDSGIDGSHRHFSAYRNLELTLPLAHQDLTGGGSPLTDAFGHGTHVAGILAGYAKGTRTRPLKGSRKVRLEDGTIAQDDVPLAEMAGMAPRCRLVSYKVLDENGDGDTSTIIRALRHIDEVNEHGRVLRIHGVNLSVGYAFEPEWFACGYSPLCVEVDRLVRSGVVVVVSAGNSGYGLGLDSDGNASLPAGVDLTINDPGNAELAITVGSTHRDSPHQYGVSFFSSKGPTGDGRPKPDLVAPGERILAPAAGRLAAAVAAPASTYAEDSGTSMSAPHVSGAIAAFLSARAEFVGRPDRVKEIFTDSATDLRRTRAFQGHGLLDLLRALQSV